MRRAQANPRSHSAWRRAYEALTAQVEAEKAAFRARERDGDGLRASIRQLTAEREFVNKALSALTYRLAELEFERQASIIEGASKAASKAAGGMDPG